MYKDASDLIIQDILILLNAIQFGSVQSGSILNGVADLALGWTETGQNTLLRGNTPHIWAYTNATPITLVLRPRCVTCLLTARSVACSSLEETGRKKIKKNKNNQLYFC